MIGAEKINCTTEKWKIIIIFDFSIASVCLQWLWWGECSRVYVNGMQTKSPLVPMCVCVCCVWMHARLHWQPQLKTQLRPSPALRVLIFSLVLVSHEDCDEFHSIMRKFFSELFSRLASASTETYSSPSDGGCRCRRWNRECPRKCVCVIIGASSIRLHFYAHHFYLRFLWKSLW